MQNLIIIGEECASWKTFPTMSQCKAG